jgi:hypothetical protein
MLHPVIRNHLFDLADNPWSAAVQTWTELTNVLWSQGENPQENWLIEPANRVEPCPAVATLELWQVEYGAAVLERYLRLLVHRGLGSSPVPPSG